MYLLPSNIFCWVSFSFYRTPEERAKWALNLRSWKTIYLKIIGLFLSYFWCTTFNFLLLCSEKIIWFLLFKLVWHVSFTFTLYFLLFSCSAFHKNFDKRFLKFVWNSRSSLRAWQFHCVVVNQIVNFKTKLWISHRISLGSCKVRRERSSHNSV